MFFKVDLLPNRIVQEDETEELIWNFLCALQNNGQILKDYKLVKDKNYTMYLTLPKPDSFDDSHDSVHVARFRKEISEIYDVTFTPLGENAESQLYCECKKRTAMEMQPYNRDIDSVFTCCDCGKPIALYELPLPGEAQEDHYLIQAWQTNFAAVDALWMGGLCDRYTGNQRVKHDSALNSSGIEIARYLSEKLGHPVYYHLECDYGRSVRAERVEDSEIHICPACERLMKRMHFSDDYERDICQECELSYDAH